MKTFVQISNLAPFRKGSIGLFLGTLRKRPHIAKVLLERTHRIRILFVDEKYLETDKLIQDIGESMTNIN